MAYEFDRFEQIEATTRIYKMLKNNDEKLDNDLTIRILSGCKRWMVGAVSWDFPHSRSNSRTST